MYQIYTSLFQELHSMCTVLNCKCDFFFPPRQNPKQRYKILKRISTTKESPLCYKADSRISAQIYAFEESSYQILLKKYVYKQLFYKQCSLHSQSKIAEQHGGAV